MSGWSAGAHLVAMALDHPRASAGLALSGVYDLAPIRDTSLNNALKLTDEEVTGLSPLRLPVTHKRLDIAYGSSELPALVLDSINFHEKRMAAQAPGKLIPVAGADHFTILEALRRPDGVLVDAAPPIAGLKNLENNPMQSRIRSPWIAANACRTAAALLSWAAQFIIAPLRAGTTSSASRQVFKQQAMSRARFGGRRMRRART